MPPSGEIKDIDRGMRAALATMAAAAAKPGAHVNVGWPASAGAHVSGITLSQLAVIHEYGTARTPQRSMLRATMEIYQDRYIEALRKIGIGIAHGRIDLQRGLDLLGVMIKGDVQKRIAAGIMPPNAASTIKRKGSSTPLIHTGQLRTSIEHEVKGA